MFSQTVIQRPLYIESQTVGHPLVIYTELIYLDPFNFFDRPHTEDSFSGPSFINTPEYYINKCSDYKQIRGLLKTEVKPLTHVNTIKGRKTPFIG